MAERLSKPTEDQLFGKFRKTGKPRYLSEVFDRTAPELLRVALHLARNPAQADDLVQSTFLEAIRGAKGWDPERRVLPWLLGILTNLARDARRQERRTLEEERLVPPKAAGPATEAEALEFTRAVDDAVQKMPDPYRPVLVLHLRHGLAPAEIGAALGRPSGTVRSQLARGLERLRRLLPAGFAAALAGLITPSRGLAAIREAVLAQAVPPAIVTTATGVLAMKKILTVCGLVLAALTLWMVSLEEGDAVPDNLDRESGAQTLRAAATGAVPAQTAVVEHRAPVETVDLGESATGSLLVRVLWQPGGAPAQGVGVQVQPLALGDPLLRERRGSTDARGSVSFEDLPGGTVRVMLDRAEGPEVVVPARGREEVTLELGSAVVRGRVVDLDGSPVPEALLWIAKRGLADHARVAGRADFEGRFEFRGLGADHLIAAFAEGFRPCAPLEASAGEEVTLRLSRDAASIVGMVTDVEGRPVPDARVRIGTEAPPFYLISPDAPEKLELFTNQPPVTVQTDEHGWYRSDSAISGSEVEVFVRAADHVGQVAKVRLQRGEPTRHDVTLERGSTVVGRIVSPSGRPVPGVPVRVQKPGLGEPGWLHASTRTARDGEYRLTGLPPGMQRLRAEGGEQGEATGELVLAAGETRRWDAVLGGGPVIAGRVVDGEGAPLGGMIVALQAEGSPRRQVETDADGAFHFSDCKDTGHLVTVSDPDNLLPIPLLAEDGVRPGTERVLTVDLPRITGWIEASVLGPDGLPVADARLRLMNRDHAAMVDAEPDTGSRFHVGPIPVGSYELRLVCHRFPSVDLGTVQLEAGQTLNLGLHQFAPGGWLQLDVQDADGRMPEKMSISLRDADGMEAALPGLVGGDFRTQALPVGDYRLTVWGPGIPVTRSRATIRPDQVTDAPLRLERGREITFLLRGASVEMAGGKPFVLATTLFEDGEGNVLADHSFIFDDLERLRFSQPFLPGRYRIRVDTETGYAGELEFEVGVGTPEQVEVWLEK